MIRKVSLFIGIVFALSGCTTSEEKSVEEAKEFIATFDKNLTEEEVEGIKDQISDAFYSADHMGFSEAFAFEAIILKGVSDLGTNPFKANDIEKMADKFSMSGELAAQIINNFENYDCVKTYVNQEGYTTVVFRAYGSFGLNYHELMLAKVENEVKVIDIYLVMSGENLSKTLTNIMMTFNESQSKNEVLDGDPTMVKEYLAMEEYEKAFDEIQKLPKTVRESKTFSILELMALSGMDDQLYYEALEGYRENFPDNVSADLISLDYYFLEESYDKALEVLENIQEIYPEDGVIDYYIADIHYAQGDCEYAIFSCKEACEKSPNILAFKDFLSSYHFECGDKHYAFDLSDELIDDGYMTLDDNLNYLEEFYSNYQSWPEYQQWIEKYQ